METEPFGGIRVGEILEVLQRGEIIEEYPDDKPYPSCLILGRTLTGRVLILFAPRSKRTQAYPHSDLSPRARAMGRGIHAAEAAIKCVICKTGEVRSASVQAEIKAGPDRLLVPVEAEMCQECGEPYYSTEVLRYLDRVREDFVRRDIAPASAGKVYQVS